MRGSLRAAVLALLASGGCSPGTGYPNRPILILCPWRHGGGSDTVARHIAALLQKELGVAVNVQNVTGGDGVTGHSEGARAAPDGYTLTLMTVEINMLHWRGLTKVSPRDFAPLALANRDAAAVFVRSDSPWNTLKELEEAVRRSPGALRASGTATGGIWHLGLAGWLSKVGLKPSDINWISFAGAAPSLAELRGKGLEVVACSLPEARTFLDSRDVRCLGVMAPDRHPQFPDVPTFREQGIDWSMGAWRGIGAPRATPGGVTRTIASALQRVLSSPEYLGAMGAAGFGTAREPPAEFEQTLRRQDAQMGALLTSEAFRGLDRKEGGLILFPALVAAALLGVLVALGVQVVRARRHNAPVALPPPSGAALLRAGEVVLAVVLYIPLSGVLGFVLTAALLEGALFLRFGVRPRVAAIVTVAVVPAVYHLFANLLFVPLPRGILGW